MKLVNRNMLIKKIREYAECSEECARTFHYGFGCKDCAFGTIIKIVEKQPYIEADTEKWIVDEREES